MLKPLFYTEHFANMNAGKKETLPVVVLIHGLFGSGDNLSVIRRHLELNYRVINIDLPDHGKSPWSSTFSFEHYAQQILLTLSQLDITKASFVAHSLGGKVAMYLAHMNPIIVNKLIILDIAPIVYEPRHHSVIEGLTSLALPNIDSRKQAQTEIATYINDPGIQSFLLKSLYEEDKQWQWRFNLNLLVKDYGALSDWPLAGKKVYDGKVLFLKGEDSDYIEAKHQSSIMTQFPQAAAKVVKAGHWLHAEKPQVVNSLITKHLHGE